jgi:hypothetical protein
LQTKNVTIIIILLLSQIINSVYATYLAPPAVPPFQNTAGTVNNSIGFVVPPRPSGSSGERQVTAHLPVYLMTYKKVDTSKYISENTLITLPLMKSESLVFSALISIVLIGLVGIPFGDPRFIPIAVLLELVFIGLAILVLKGYSRPLYICIVLASLIIIGNSITTAHIYRMMTFAKPVNTIVLIIGGYILQALLIYASAIAIMNRRRRDSSSSNKTLAASHY